MEDNQEFKIVPYFDGDTMENAKTFKLIRKKLNEVSDEIHVGDLETCMYYLSMYKK